VEDYTGGDSGEYEALSSEKVKKIGRYYGYYGGYSHPYGYNYRYPYGYYGKR